MEIPTSESTIAKTEVDGCKLLTFFDSFLPEKDRLYETYYTAKGHPAYRIANCATEADALHFHDMLARDLVSHLAAGYEPSTIFRPI